MGARMAANLQQAGRLADVADENAPPDQLRESGRGGQSPRCGPPVLSRPRTAVPLPSSGVGQAVRVGEVRSRSGVTVNSNALRPAHVQRAGHLPPKGSSQASELADEDRHPLSISSSLSAIARSSSLVSAPTSGPRSTTAAEQGHPLLRFGRKLLDQISLPRQTSLDDSSRAAICRFLALSPAGGIERLRGIRTTVPCPTC